MQYDKATRWRSLMPKWARSAVMTTMVGGVVLAGAPGCLDRPLEVVEPRTTTTIIERLTQSSVDKIDLLLVIDNSRSMADKQEILNLAVPDLVNQLINPQCGLVDKDTGEFVAGGQQPADPLQDCPIAGDKREFDPILDIHIGILTSSIGGHGADACEATSIPSENDKAHLIQRSGTGVSDPVVPTWQDKGFLAWDPNTDDPSHDPPGEIDQTSLITNLTQMVSGAGEVGCGYEATLEAWYRFLVDPDPYETITLENNSAVLQDTDNVLLGQRKDFLRPDSLLAVIMLSDENDCSIRDGSQFYFAAQIYQPNTNNPYHLPNARAACASDPNDPCCRSCGQGPGEGCSEANDDCSGPLAALDDNINLRCFHQKERFGIDFLWPIDRYTVGVSQSQVQDRHGNVVANPLFTDLDTDDDNSAVRDPGLVFVAGIVGVPWHDIARQAADGTPDLISGLNLEGQIAGGFQSGVELAIPNDITNLSTWDVILGDPTCYASGSACLPADPLMEESFLQRTGTNPVTNDALAPGGAGLLANPINGHEYTIDTKDDLQYACIFPLTVPRDCTDASNTACDCVDPMNDNPLCQDSTGAYGQTQYFAKAYPGVRELNVLKNIGTQGIVGSICPAQQTDNTLINFGYRPAVKAIVDRLKQALGGQCLPRSLTPDGSGQVTCLILEARNIGGNVCSDVCSTNGRNFIDQDHPAVLAAKEDPLAKASGWDCYCEITQLEGDELVACQTDVADTPVANGAAVHGWCYVDASAQPPIGNPDIVASCPETERRLIRFVGDGQGSTGATLFITCSGE
jgi:hypothetical protein